MATACPACATVDPVGPAYKVPLNVLFAVAVLKEMSYVPTMNALSPDVKLRAVVAFVTNASTVVVVVFELQATREKVDTVEVGTSRHTAPSYDHV